MNHLAHLVLSDPDPACRLGNLLADFVRGTEAATLPTRVFRGIRMHRRIDSFTDMHQVVHRSMNRLKEEWSWYKGILIDVYYDHVLARNWPEFHPRPLREFLDEVHEELRAAVQAYPSSETESILRIVNTDRLHLYAEPDGAGVLAAYQRITRILRKRMPHRVIDLAPAFPELHSQYDAFLEDFREFFPELVEFTRQWSRENPD